MPTLFFQTKEDKSLVAPEEPYRFKLNPKIEALIPRCTEEEYNELLASLKKDGQWTTPIGKLTVSKDGTLLDGYTRYRMLTEILGKTDKDILLEINPDIDLRLPYQWNKVVNFVTGCSKRRNLNKFQLTKIIIEKEGLDSVLNTVKETTKFERDKHDLAEKIEAEATLEDICKTSGIPYRRLRSVAFILKNLKNAPDEIKTEFMNGLNEYRGEKDVGLTIDNVENRLRNAIKIDNEIQATGEKPINDITFSEQLKSAYGNTAKYQEGAYEKFRKEVSEYFENSKGRQLSILNYRKLTDNLFEVIRELKKCSKKLGYAEIYTYNPEAGGYVITVPLTEEQEAEISNIESSIETKKRQPKKMANLMAQLASEGIEHRGYQPTV